MSVTKLIATLLVALLLIGCAQASSEPKPPEQKQPAPATEPTVTPEPTETPVTVVLYFADKNAEYLVAEERTVSKKGESLEEVIVRELAKGPMRSDLSRTIPKEASVIPPVKVVDKVAFVNFTRELKTKHWGGSAGELLTVYSIVQSLTELPGIERVQILIEGEREETLVGHLIINEPIGPNPDIVKK